MLDDLRLLQANCATFNGPQHPLTLEARGIVGAARRAVKEAAADLDVLEAAARPAACAAGARVDVFGSWGGAAPAWYAARVVGVDEGDGKVRVAYEEDGTEERVALSEFHADPAADGRATACHWRVAAAAPPGAARTRGELRTALAAAEAREKELQVCFDAAIAERDGWRRAADDARAAVVAAEAAAAAARRDRDEATALCREAVEVARAVPDWKRMLADVTDLLRAAPERRDNFHRLVEALKAAKTAGRVPSLSGALFRDAPAVVGRDIWDAALARQRPPGAARARAPAGADGAADDGALWLEVPPGSGPGAELFCEAPGYPRVKVVVPDDVGPGDRFRVILPPVAPQPPLTRPDPPPGAVF